MLSQGRNPVPWSTEQPPLSGESARLWRGIWLLRRVLRDEQEFFKRGGRGHSGRDNSMFKAVTGVGTHDMVRAIVAALSS